MNSMKRNVACAALAVAVCGAGRAGTIGWWRFEDGAAGTSAASLTNRMDASRLPGSAVGITGSGLPQFADAFADAVLWNPVESRAEANDRALRFSDGNGNAGRVVIASDAALSPQTFTLEFFFKYEGTGLPNWMPLVGRMNGEKTESFYVRLHKTSGDSPLPSISVRFHSADGASSLSSDFAQAALTDGAWHHVALCVFQDGTAWNVKAYADYQVIGSRALTTGPVAFADDYPLLIGGAFPGLIDEVRLSDSVLDPKEFLRRHEVSPFADADTAVYLDFAALPAVNKAPAESPFSVASELDTKSATALSDDRPGHAVRADAWSAQSVANATALCLATNDACRTSPGRLTYDDTQNRLAANSFTAELFFKIDDFGDGSGSQGDCIYLFCSPTWFLRVMREDHSLSSYFKIGGQDVSLPLNAKLEPGIWHHAAIVYDTAAQTLRVYLDYRCRNSRSGVTLDVKESSCPTAIAGGMWNGGQYQFSRGAIDEVRITRRALKPAEFLTVAPATDGKLIHLDYETDAVASCVNGFVFGGAWTNNAANPPTLSTRVPGAPLLDAAGQVVRAANAHSLHYDNRYIAYDDNRYIAYDAASVLDRADFTLEFFLRADATKASAGVMRLVDNLNDNDFVWGLRTDETGRTLEVVASTATAANAVVATFPADSLDGRWHHYAVNFKTVEANTAVTLYRDYETVGEATLNGRLAVADGVSRFYVGGGSAGRLDEIVIWDGAKGPDDFLRARKRGGLVILR